ncbi:MAG TPA: glycoside hydrolase family 11 protein [Marinilabiliaceae bacterium]|nr:glycoside hydrolase family 11 protein [Marinilabiliaceae bacterium]
MKRSLFQNVWKLFPLISALVFFAFTATVNAQTITSNQTGSQGGYTYEFWKDSGGSGSMTLGSGGAFSAQWSNVGNILMRKGLRPGSKSQTVTYSASYNPSGNSYLCVYGWTTNPLVEYYIVDSWGSWRPPGGSSKGTVTTDGGTYDIYETTRTNQPSIEGTKTFKQFWSVRTSKRSSGTITCANHFNAWASKGMNMGNMYEVSLTVEGYQSSGSANVTSMSMGTGGGTTQPPAGGGTTTPPSTGATTIVVRARGTSGSEKINLRIDNQTIATYSLTTSMQNYTASTNSNGGINIEYFNDASGRDVQVDYIQVNGSTRQAEAQSYNTAAYANGQCGGGSYTEWMHCNGVLGFGNVKSSFIEASPESESELSAAPALYPNPTTGELNIELAGGMEVVRVLDTNGRVLRVFELSGKNNLNTNLNLEPGVYIIDINDGTKSIMKKLLVE